MPTLKQSRELNKKVEQLLIGMNAIKNNRQTSGFTYSLQTIAGGLDISCHEPDNSPVLSIYLRFDDYDKAVSVLGYEELGCNPKWNIHTTGSVEDALQYLNYKLDLVQAVQFV
jgi:hypothetical protein